LSCASAETFVINPRFESDALPNGQTWAYSTGSTGWTPFAAAGISAANVITPFATGGTNADGNTVEFLQSVPGLNAGISGITQTISGLEVGKTYWVQFYCSTRGEWAGVTYPNQNITVKMDNNTVGSATNVSSASGSYRFVNTSFTATSTNMLLSISTQSTNGGDGAALLDANATVAAGLDSLALINDVAVDPSGFTKFTAIFTATSTDASLYIAQSADGGQIAVDNVSIVAVPEPHTLLLGLTGAAIFGWNRSARRRG